jgi:hypothetical protein
MIILSFRGARAASEPGIQKQAPYWHLDSGSGATIGPAFGRTRWRRPGMTEMCERGAA